MVIQRRGDPRRGGSYSSGGKGRERDGERLEGRIREWTLGGKRVRREEEGQGSASSPSGQGNTVKDYRVTEFGGKRGYLGGRHLKYILRLVKSMA